MMRIKETPDIIQIASTNRCNLHCKMCQREHLDVKYVNMEFSVYKKITDRLPDFVKAVDLTGWGEIMLHPKIFQMLKYAKRRGFITYSTTNGTMLSPANIRKLLDSNLDSLTISIENLSSRNNTKWTHPYSKEIIKNIKNLVRSRGKKPGLHISLCVTLHKGSTKNVLNIVRFANKLGIDSVHIGRLNTVFAPGLQRPSPREEISVWKKCLKLRGNGVPKVLMTQFQFLGLKKIYPIEEFCPKIYNYAYINVEGKLTPCCMLPNHEIGDVLKEGLGSLWKSKKFNYFRKHQKQICDRVCNMYRYP